MKLKREDFLLDVEEDGVVISMLPVFENKEDASKLVELILKHTEDFEY